MGKEAIDRIRRGVVPLPPRPGQREGEREEDAAAAAPAATDGESSGTLFGYNLDELQKRFAAACTRIGDGRMYGAGRTCGSKVGHSARSAR